MTDQPQNPDERTLRCRRLGHEVPFKYCRTLEGNTICPRIRDCWWERFDIDAWLKDNVSKEEHKRLIEGVPPKPKVETILDIINRVKKDQS